MDGMMGGMPGMGGMPDGRHDGRRHADAMGGMPGWMTA